MLVASKVQIVETCGYLGNPVIIGSDLVEKDYINISQEKLWGYELDNQNENTELVIVEEYPDVNNADIQEIIINNEE